LDRKLDGVRCVAFILNSDTCFIETGPSLFGNRYQFVPRHSQNITSEEAKLLSSLGPGGATV
jgi:hypothetical protein